MRAAFLLLAVLLLAFAGALAGAFAGALLFAGADFFTLEVLAADAAVFDLVFSFWERPELV